MDSLLNCIHNDTGQHTKRVGLRQSTRDAHDVFIKMLRRIDDLAEAEVVKKRNTYCARCIHMTLYPDRNDF